MRGRCFFIGEFMTKRKITKAEDLRGALLATIEGVLEGRVNVSQANAVVGLSGELHKSIKQEWDMRVFANEKLALERGRILEVIGCEDDSAE
jgi:hypothetical protein